MMKRLERNRVWLCVALIGILMMLSQTVSARTVYVKGSEVNIRSGHGTQYKIVDKVKWADQLETIGKDTNKNWLYIKTPKGRKGWIHKKLIQSQTPITYKMIRTKSLDIGPYGAFQGAKRFQYDIEVPLATTDEQVKVIIKKAVKDLAARREVNALTIHLFLKGTNLPYAIADWAPEGDWGKAETGKPKSIFRTSIKIFEDRRPKKEMMKRKEGLSLSTRKKIFWEIVTAEDRGTRLAQAKYKYDIMKQIDYERELQKKFKEEVRKKYGITEKQLREISIEGVKNNWPMPKP